MRVSGQDTHSVLVDYDTFVNVTMPDKTDPQLQARRSGLPAEAGLSGCRRRSPCCRPSTTTTRVALQTSARTRAAGPCLSRAAQLTVPVKGCDRKTWTK
jgi:hypothetical protein